MNDRKAVGQRGEDLAAEYLESQGWTILDRNWRCLEGELDLVALSPDRVLVFCEVKCRSGLGFGNPLEAITAAKMLKLRTVASRWLATHNHRGEVRFDGIGVLVRRGFAPQLTHIEGIGL